MLQRDATVSIKIHKQEKEQDSYHHVVEFVAPYLVIENGRETQRDDGMNLVLSLVLESSYLEATEDFSLQGGSSQGPITCLMHIRFDTFVVIRVYSYNF